jgi:hypothetical protein
MIEVTNVSKNASKSNRIEMVQPNMNLPAFSTFSNSIQEDSRSQIDEEEER